VSSRSCKSSNRDGRISGPDAFRPAAFPVATFAALGAILLWSTLATFGVSLAHLPPLFLTGCALCIGALPGITHIRQWRVPPPTLLLGVGGLFGFHFLLFVALRYAPPVEANLVNYLWPLLIVLLTPLLLPGWRLALRHVVGAMLGFAGAALAIGAAPTTFTPAAMQGFAFAAGSALVWACYSLLTRRVAHFSSWAIGGFALASGLLALALHFLFEAPAQLRDGDAGLLVLLGLGPMGLAFYLWDFAMKRGDPRVIGVLAYSTPLLSTALLVAVAGRALTPALALATLLVVTAAVLASSAPRA
jgi:drug/metabolite transporter (DMT)-like permease